MAYIKEEISQADKTRIGFDKLWTSWRPPVFQWVINRENGNWLFRTFWGSEHDRQGRSYIFCYKNLTYQISAEVEEKNAAGGSLIYVWKLKYITIKPLKEDADFFIELKKALSADDKRFENFYKSVEFNFNAAEGASK